MSGLHGQEVLSVPLHGTEDERLRNYSHDHTIAFHGPSNGNLYIALTTNAFGQYICGWKRVVPDCILLLSRSLERLFKTLDLQKSMSFVNESVENVSISID